MTPWPRFRAGPFSCGLPLEWPSARAIAMGIIKDLKGRRFGRLTAISRIHIFKRSNRRAYWRCLCDCGNTHFAVSIYLVHGNIQSCGCLRRDRLITANKTTYATHGHTRNARATRTYKSWKSMIERCEKPYHKAYESYGGAGVTVCERWHNFEAFLADMGERPAGMTLDRWPNPAGNYEPGNTRWATPLEQRHNRRNK